MKNDQMDEVFNLKKSLREKEIELEELIQHQRHVNFDYEGQIKELQIELDGYKTSEQEKHKTPELLYLRSGCSLHSNPNIITKNPLDENATKLAEEIKKMNR